MSRASKHDHFQAFYAIRSPSDLLMRLIRQKMSLRMTNNRNTDEFALSVSDLYRRFSAGATRMCPPDVDIVAFLWNVFNLERMKPV